EGRAGAVQPVRARRQGRAHHRRARRRGGMSVVEVAPRIARRFAALRAAGRKALVPFITAGDPSLEDTVPVMHAMVEAGADAIELGVPFSDPMADGPTIQRSSERALARGAGMAWVLERVREFRERDDDTPVTLMGYL